MKQAKPPLWPRCTAPAAFGRLCVETPALPGMLAKTCPAAFGRLCVETTCKAATCMENLQPPSGGCVLKHNRQQIRLCPRQPAAFGRLCVETLRCPHLFDWREPAAFGRLCVETLYGFRIGLDGLPAAFGRLCVETPSIRDYVHPWQSSRLRAAVC